MNTTNKFICIHGHFYQPPRENAWLEVVEMQDSAAPFHDWNERINFECYAPNIAARILDNQQFITKIINNYTRISFNFGATLLSWLEQMDPETYKAILDADKISQTRFGGHGSAIAQVHSHIILPLANRRDKETQIIWGLRDFEYRFKPPWIQKHSKCSLQMALPTPSWRRVRPKPFVKSAIKTGILYLPRASKPAARIGVCCLPADALRYFSIMEVSHKV
ncbi:MAG TPA: hypothetical protein PKE68_05055 [Saprospiraceae bacterium]|nr:hypothetical protein [Saprospiraceae bacterium]